jgi:hypothetical protein
MFMQMCLVNGNPNRNGNALLILLMVNLLIALTREILARNIIDEGIISQFETKPLELSWSVISKE